CGTGSASCRSIWAGTRTRSSRSRSRKRSHPTITRAGSGSRISTMADPKHDDAAIRQHQAILRVDHKRVESYKALRALYLRAGRRHAARAVDDALATFGVHAPDASKLDALFEPSAVIESPLPALREPPSVPLNNDDWLALARVDVDLQLSVLFALVAPPFAVERA